MSKLAVLVSVLSWPLPWSFRRFFLERVCGFKIHRTAHISRFALVAPFRLEAGPWAYIGPFTVCKGLSLLRLEEYGFIGPFNWITAFPQGTNSKHFEMNPERKPQLLVERHAAITNRHIIDCTDEVKVGAFSTFAGFRSQILTHSIDLKESRQRCNPVRIGHHCFVGTNCVLLGGSVLPDRSVLAAHSMLAACLETPATIYGGVPAKAIKPIDPEDRYFLRETGYVL